VAASAELAPPAPVAVSAREQLGAGRGRMPAASRAGASPRLWWVTLAIAAVFCWITFYAKGGLNLESMTGTEMGLTLGSGVIVAAAALLASAATPRYGLGTALAMLAFTALTALSIVWSVQPDHSWQDSGRMLAFSGVFIAAIALARLAPRRWPAALGGLTLAATVVCGYALLTKVFPAGLAPTDAFARLNEPYGYWNAVGLSAALGTICCLWLGARRGGHALVRALAYPAMGLMLLTLALAYSRGAMAALAIGVVLWLCIVPLRLRGAVLLVSAGLAAGAVTAWDFSRSALSDEGVPLAERVSAGHELGALVVAMVVALTAAGVLIGFHTGRRAPSALARRRAGAALLAVVALVAIAFVAALAHSHRGFTGSISHAVSSLTNPNAKPPPNTPGRLTAVASERARYWKEALEVFEAHPLLGSGAEGFATAHLRYEKQTLEVRHAHGFIVQTLADLGIVGLLLALVLLVSWLVAAARATHPLGGRLISWRELRAGVRPLWRRLEKPHYSAERVGMLSMLCVVVTFGVHSLVDWTWYVPGDACVALLCAGWLAGRGPLEQDAEYGLLVQDTSDGVRAHDPPAHDALTHDAPTHDPARSRLRSAFAPPYTRALVAVAAIVAALLAAWSQWQPQRSEEARQSALALVSGTPIAARREAETAVSRDPLSVEALFTLASIQRVLGEATPARMTLERAVRLQPSNPLTWLNLGRYNLSYDPAAAVKDIEASIYLDPQSISAEAIAAGEPEAIEIHNQYIEALEAAQKAPAASAAGSSTALKSASGSPAQAAAGGRQGTRRRRAHRSHRSRTP